ncbi:unnamed protein product [Allacma fusca]|uniref:Nose resistant-to-fluoxetine protein N-terminal domain-containing protein n=1 Tax=Allacma fusca TaxID=39272 RepID=A0A8J2KGC7_9HEXA|nr:unnamed protein product [Allacma fusca]
MEKHVLTGFLNGLLILLIAFSQVHSQGSIEFTTQIFKKVEPHFKVFREKWLMLHDRKEDVGKNSMKNEFNFSNILSTNLEAQIFLDLILANVSKSCSDQVRWIISTATSGNASRTQEDWALQMLDSNGKLTPLFFRVDISAPGDFHRCMQVQADLTDLELAGSEFGGPIKGKYCISYLFPKPSLWTELGYIESQESSANASPSNEEKSFELVIERIRSSNVLTPLPMIGNCLPASCSDNDVGDILNMVHDKLQSNYLGQVVMACYDNERNLDTSALFFVVILITIVTLCVVGTFLDIYISPMNRTFSNTSVGLRIILSFSFYTNTKKLLSTSNEPGQLNCINGIRFLVTGWILLGHIFIFIWSTSTSNFMDLSQLHKDWVMWPVLNTPVAVDTFFTISGALVAYFLLKELDKTGGYLNYPLFVLDRLLRLLPTYLFTAGFAATLLPYLGSGPFWYLVEEESEACKRHWWHNILFINNFMSYEVTQMCNPAAWYLANDTQFYFLAPLLILPLWRKKEVGLALTGITLTGILGLVSVILPGIIKANKNLPPALTFGLDMKSYMVDIYFKPWTRCGTYIVGILLGYLLHSNDKTPARFANLSKRVVRIGWLTSTIVAFGILFGGAYYSDPDKQEAIYNSIHSAVYCGLHRVIWSMCVAWSIFACATGNGGLADTILSYKIFEPLARLTFGIYFSSYQVQMVYHYMQPHPFYYSKYNLFFLFFGHLGMCLLASYALTMLVTTPFTELTKIAFRRREKKLHPGRSTVKNE